MPTQHQQNGQQAQDIKREVANHLMILRHPLLRRRRSRPTEIPHPSPGGKRHILAHTVRVVRAMSLPGWKMVTAPQAEVIGRGPVARSMIDSRL